MDDGTVKSFELPNGHTVRYVAAPDLSDDAYVLEVFAGKTLISRTCSCNGVSRECPPGTSPRCDCTRNPPVLTCV